jgi:hypothetical protein
MATLVTQVKSIKETITMIEFIASNWLAVVPTAVTGMALLGMLKKMRDEKARKEKAPATIEVRRKR